MTSLGKVTLTGLFLLVLVPLYAGKIDKAFDALKIYDYFKAKKYFEKSLRSDPSVAAFGMATIYYRHDNPFHSLDSAYKYVQLSETQFPETKAGKLLRYQVYGFTQTGVDSLRQLISTEFYKLTTQQNSVAAYQLFINEHPWAQEMEQAVYKRDSIAFEEAKQLNTAMAFAHYRTTYPASAFDEAANEQLMDAQYRETTRPQTLQSYETFLKAYPQNAHIGEAEDKIYQLVTKANTIEALEGFIQKYPSNQNIRAAWERLYQLNVYEYTAENIALFAEKYPDYPFLEDLKFDLNLIEYNLFPFESNGLYGFMDTTGSIVIPAQYKTVSPFKEGLALVSKNNKFGYINKKGEVAVAMTYDGGLDFEQGRAIIEKSDRYGMIDRTGAVIIEPEFEDLGVISENLIYGLRDSLYAYYNTSGKQVIGERFTEAFSFSKGLAKVEEKGLQAYIDHNGKYVVHPAFKEITFFTDSLLIFGNGDTYGLMKPSCEIVVPNKYLEIGQPSEGLAIVVDGDEYLGYINERGEEVIAPQYDLIPNYLDRSQFRQGAAIVSKDDQYGIINTKGKDIIPFKYDNIGSWGELIAAQKKGKWGYINRANQFVIQPAFDFAETFEGSVGLVQEVSLYGAVNKSGQKIIETAYNNIDIVHNGFMIVNNGALFGLVSSKGETVLPMIYQTIRVFDDNYLILSNTEGISYFDCKTGERLKLKQEHE